MAKSGPTKAHMRPFSSESQQLFVNDDVHSNHSCLPTLTCSFSCAHYHLHSICTISTVSHCSRNGNNKHRQSCRDKEYQAYLSPSPLYCPPLTPSQWQEEVPPVSSSTKHPHHQQVQHDTLSQHPAEDREEQIVQQSSHHTT